MDCAEFRWTIMAFCCRGQQNKGNNRQLSPYLPSEASPVTETTPQSGQPRPSPVILTRVSSVPLCRLLRCCQPGNDRGMKEVSGWLHISQSGAISRSGLFASYNDTVNRAMTSTSETIACRLVLPQLKII